MNHTRTMLKGTLILTLSGFLTKIIGFLYRIFLSQTIGSTGMGIYQLIFPIHALCFALTVGGIQTAISRLVAAKFAKKEDSDARAVFLIATSFSTLLSILVTFFLFHYADWFAIHILFEPQCTSLLKVSSLSIPMGTFHSCVNGYYFAVLPPPICFGLSGVRKDTQSLLCLLSLVFFLGNLFPCCSPYLLPSWIFTPPLSLFSR